jgi:hypothetical protein
VDIFRHMEKKRSLQIDPNSIKSFPEFSDDPVSVTMSKKPNQPNLQKSKDPRVGTGWADHRQQKFSENPT